MRDQLKTPFSKDYSSESFNESSFESSGIPLNLDSLMPTEKADQPSEKGKETRSDEAAASATPHCKGISSCVFIVINRLRAHGHSVNILWGVRGFALRKFSDFFTNTSGVSGQAVQSFPLTSLKLSMAVCGQKTGCATFRMNDQNSSLRRPSEGTLN